MKGNYLKISNYIVSIDLIHGVLKLSGLSASQQVIITYTNNTSACLEFFKQSDCDEAFDKIAEALGAV